MYETIEQLMQAALANNADAQWDLAVRYANGNEVEQSNEKAFEWICRAAENGHEGAANYVLDAYEGGKEELGIQPDIEKLVEWADKLSENGSAAMRIKYAQVVLSPYAATPEGKNADIYRGFERVAELADKGNIECALLAYHTGHFIGRRDADCPHMERAIKYMSMLDGTNKEISKEMKYNTWYDYGTVLLRLNKDAESMHWFQMATPYIADAELIYTSLLYGQVCGEGMRSSPLWVEVYTHAKHAAERNDCPKRKDLEGMTCALLSQLTRDGLGTPVDLDASYRWCVRAAELGDETSKQRLPHYHKKLFGGYTFK